MIDENRGRESLRDVSCGNVVVLSLGNFVFGVLHFAFFQDASELSPYLQVEIALRMISALLANLPFHCGSSTPIIERYNPACWYCGGVEYFYVIQGV